MLSSVMMAHVFFESSCAFFINLTAVSLGILQTLCKACVLLKDIKAHLENVVHLKLIAEALFLMICVDIAESLATRGMLNSHFLTS